MVPKKHFTLLSMYYKKVVMKTTDTFLVKILAKKNSIYLKSFVNVTFEQLNASLLDSSITNPTNQLLLSRLSFMDSQTLK